MQVLELVIPATLPDAVLFGSAVYPAGVATVTALPGSP